MGFGGGLILWGFAKARDIELVKGMYANDASYGFSCMDPQTINNCIHSFFFSLLTLRCSITLYLYIHSWVVTSLASHSSIITEVHFHPPNPQPPTPLFIFHINQSKRI